MLDEAGFVPQYDSEDEEHMEEALEDQETTDEPPEEVIEEFKNFLANVSADDFEASS